MVCGGGGFGRLLGHEVGALISRTALIRRGQRDFPGGAVVKNPPANSGDTGSIPGGGRSHIPQSK